MPGEDQLPFCQEARSSGCPETTRRCRLRRARIAMWFLGNQEVLLREAALFSVASYDWDYLTKYELGTQHPIDPWRLSSSRHGWANHASPARRKLRPRLQAASVLRRLFGSAMMVQLDRCICSATRLRHSTAAYNCCRASGLLSRSVSK